METSDGGNLETAIIFGKVFRILNCKDYNSNSCRGLNSCWHYARCWGQEEQNSSGPKKLTAWWRK